MSKSDTINNILDQASISNLINDAQATYRQQLNETKKYVAKWEKTGLLEGIDSDYEKHNT